MLERYEMTILRYAMLSCEDYYEGPEDIVALIFTTEPLIASGELYTGQEN